MRLCALQSQFGHFGNKEVSCICRNSNSSLSSLQLSHYSDDPLSPISVTFSIGQKFRSTNMAKRDLNSVEILKCNYAKGHFSTINIEIGLTIKVLGIETVKTSGLKPQTIRISIEGARRYTILQFYSRITVSSYCLPSKCLGLGLIFFSSCNRINLELP